jgi:hypothetical protein
MHPDKMTFRRHPRNAKSNFLSVVSVTVQQLKGIPELLGVLVFAAFLSGCAGPKISEQGMQEKLSSLKKIAVVSVLEEKITIHDITVPLGPSESTTPLTNYNINAQMERALANRLNMNGRFQATVDSGAGARLIELGQRSYSTYPNYNRKITPYLEALKTKGVDALLVVSPFKYIMFKDPPNPLAPGYTDELKGYGLYYGPYNNRRAVYLSATISLYLTDDPLQQKMYYIRPRLFRDAKLVNAPNLKGILKGGPKFTDYPANEQANYLSELDRLIDEDVTKSLAALGLL